MPEHALFIDIQMPRPDRNASSVRSFQMLQMLRGRGIAVDMAGLVRPVDEGHRDWLDPIGVTPLPWVDEDGLRALIGRRGRRYSIVLLAWSAVARRFLPAARAAAPEALILFDTQDVNHVREYREAKATGNLRTLQRALATRAAEAQAMTIADRTIAITEADAATLQALCPAARVETVTMWTDPPAAIGRPEVPAPTVLFVGRYGAPANHDAALLLAREVLPLVRARCPAARLVLAGSEPDEAIAALASDAVEVPGWLPDLGPTCARSAVFAAPLRFGSGLKGKLLLAMAHRVPVVASPIAAEGLGAVDGRDLLIADGPAGIAAAICRVLESPALGRALAASASDLLAARFARPVVEAQFDRLLSTMRTGASPVI